MTTHKLKEKYVGQAVRIAEEGLERLTFSRIAERLHTSAQRIYYHFPGGHKELRDKVIEHALKEGNSRVIVQLIAMKDPAVKELSPGVRYKHLNQCL